MNTVWSDSIQGIGTLDTSRSLRFDDRFADKYRQAFGIADGSRILEIGCGTGALARSLGRWYNSCSVTGIDRDSAFVDYARDNSKTYTNLGFVCGDALALPFESGAFDVTISNTVSEHIEPSGFYGEQYRVLREGGICIMLSARRGINHTAKCISERGEFERELLGRTEKRFEEVDKANGVAKYGMTEAEHPAAMERYGFHDVTVDYLTISLTPDDPRFSRDEAYAMINSCRRCDLDCADIMTNIASDLVSADELNEFRRIINAQYDERLRLYDAGVKQWDTRTSVTMVVRGVK
nr:class I SAM-dependent methyltransferase [Clostridia bacterium]